MFYGKEFCQVIFGQAASMSAFFVYLAPFLSMQKLNKYKSSNQPTNQHHIVSHLNNNKTLAILN